MPNGWEIKAPEIGHYLENIRQGIFNNGSVEETTTFTVFRNARREISEIAELVAATATTSKDIAAMVTFPLHRLVLFETVAALETSVQMDENNFHQIVIDVYQHHIKSPEFKLMQNTLDSTARWYSLNIMSGIGTLDQSEPSCKLLPQIAAIATKTYETIKIRLLSAAYSPTEAIKNRDNQIIADADTIFVDNERLSANVALTLTEKIVFDKYYNVLAQAHAMKYVQEKLDKVLDNNLVKYPKTDKPLKRLSLPDEASRHTFLLLGAPASGKSSLNNLIKSKLKSEWGIDWSDTIKINTDDHRQIVSTPLGMSDDTTIHSALNDYESSYITFRAYAIVQQQLQKHKGHHLVIDGVSPTLERLRMGTLNNGILHVSCASVPVDVSIERALKRGEMTGRYINSEYILKSNQYISTNLLGELIKHCAKRKAFLTIFNTNVPCGDKPKPIIKLDLRNKKAILFDAKEMALFYGKKNLNLMAKCEESLYYVPEEKLDYTFTDQLHSLGVLVHALEPAIKQFSEVDATKVGYSAF